MLVNYVTEGGELKVNKVEFNKRRGTILLNDTRVFL